MGKKFKLKAEEIIQLIPHMGGCIASDNITVHGMPVQFMYRAEPINDMDSGWQFYSSIDTEEYINDVRNLAIYSVNTIANYDRAIIPYLNLPIGCDLVRIEGEDLFRLIPG